MTTLTDAIKLPAKAVKKIRAKNIDKAGSKSLAKAFKAVENLN